MKPHGKNMRKANIDKQNAIKMAEKSKSTSAMARRHSNVGCMNNSTPPIKRQSLRPAFSMNLGDFACDNDPADDYFGEGCSPTLKMSALVNMEDAANNTHYSTDCLATKDQIAHSSSGLGNDLKNAVSMDVYMDSNDNKPYKGCLKMASVQSVRDVEESVGMSSAASMSVFDSNEDLVEVRPPLENGDMSWKEFFGKF